MKLSDAALNQVYTITGFHGFAGQERHLHNLGLIIGANVRLVTMHKDAGILLIQNSRLALSRKLLSSIDVKEGEIAHRERMPLSKAKLGTTGKVAAIIGSADIKRRIIDKGITKGTEITVNKIAPLGDPLEVQVRGYKMNLRKEEADLIMVEV